MFEEKWKAVKKHVIKYKTAYMIGGSNIVVGGATFLITRKIDSKTIKNVSVTTKKGISIVANGSSLKNVYLIAANRQGPPSWVIRCVETGEIFASQKAAALAMELSPSELSRHLNGVIEHVNNYHFERVCMAA